MVNKFMTGTYTCEIIDDRNIKIIMDYDQNLMISQTIKYIVTIEDVTTPTSKIPSRYSVNTKYNNIKNQ